jgi:hypothetical protein
MTASVLLLLLGLLPAAGQAQGADTVTLTGQIVCSECWFEADRKTAPYGDEADMKCAIRCAKGGVPGALAVTGGGETTLYILEDGKLSLGEAGKGWTAHAGARAEVTGAARKEGDKRYLKVDALKILPAGGE